MTTAYTQTFKTYLKASASLLALPIATAGFSASLSSTAFAQSNDDDTIIVTATRRNETIQEVPLNIAYVGAAQLEEQGITDLAQIAAWVPGFHIVDQGGRGADRIVVRGLNADPLGGSEGLGNDAGGTVATYLGEIPVYIDLKLNDMERVEVLLGPQGTLYGAGTMGGAVRYIPTKPKIGVSSMEFRADTYKYSQADSFSTDFGFTANVPVNDKLAIRGSFDILNDSGFIDYGRIVREIGVSNPDPDLTNPADVAANLSSKADADWEKTISGRVALRWMPTDSIDATLTYYGQNSDVGGRTINSASAAGTGRYESGLRVLEPSDRSNELLALEVVADLGFAELTSASGLGGYDEFGNRDQTDLLISLEYSYESFPSFTARTFEEQRDRFFNQEVRLVSKGDSALSWIIGGYYNNYTSVASSAEYTPGFGAFAGFSRQDDLEYFSYGHDDLTELAGFGEIRYDFSDQWQFTAGGRYYDYKYDLFSDLQLGYFGGDPALPYSLDRIEDEDFNDGQSDSGFLYKFNTSYDFTDDVMVYATASQGYRIGGPSGVGACPNPLPPNQIVCALPNEIQYGPDKTNNYEIGLHSQWMDGRLTLNGAIYQIDWKDTQITGATVNGSQPITKNGNGARSRGFEVSMDAKLTDAFNIRGNYAYTDAKLTDTAPFLYPANSFFGIAATIDGEDGDRLPASPKNQFSVFADYTYDLSSDANLVFNYGFSGVSDVLSRVGGRGTNYTLDGYSIHNISAAYARENWTFTIYANNLFDKYAETGVTSNPAQNRTLTDSNGGDVVYRGHRVNVLSPQAIGAKFNYKFR